MSDDNDIKRVRGLLAEAYTILSLAAEDDEQEKEIDDAPPPPAADQTAPFRLTHTEPPTVPRTIPLSAQQELIVRNAQDRLVGALVFRRENDAQQAKPDRFGIVSRWERHGWMKVQWIGGSLRALRETSVNTASLLSPGDNYHLLRMPGAVLMDFLGFKVRKLNLMHHEVTYWARELALYDPHAALDGVRESGVDLRGALK